MGSNPCQGPILFYPRIFRILFFHNFLKLACGNFCYFFFQNRFYFVISIQYTISNILEPLHAGQNLKVPSVYFDIKKFVFLLGVDRRRILHLSFGQFYRWHWGLFRTVFRRQSIVVFNSTPTYFNLCTWNSSTLKEKLSAFFTLYCVRMLESHCTSTCLESRQFLANHSAQKQSDKYLKKQNEIGLTLV